MIIEVNGEKQELPASMTVGALLTRLELSSQRVAVEKNRELVPRAEHAATPLEDGDKLEIVHFVGGG
jgi:sulfur carrier protein